VKIALVKLSAMGDIIHAMVALQFIKKHLPDAQIDWIVEGAFVGLLQNNPHIETILPVHLKAIKKNKFALLGEIKTIRSYATNNYDIVIDAQGLIKSALVAKLLGGKVYGFDKDSIREGAAAWFYDEGVSIPYHENTIERNLRVICEPLGIRVGGDELLDIEPFLGYEEDGGIEGLIDSGRKNIVFVIGSTWESRNYPKEHFQTIANELRENVIIVWGSAAEQEGGAFIARGSSYATLAPKLSLNGLKALIARCDLLIGNDTGPTHMAWGLCRPSITIFGPTPTSRVLITPINRVIKSPSIVNPYKLDKNDFSIKEIDPHEIVALAKELLYG